MKYGNFVIYFYRMLDQRTKTDEYSRVPNTRGCLLIFNTFPTHHSPLPSRTLLRPSPFINFGRTVSRAQFNFYVKFRSKDKKSLQCTQTLIGMFSFRKTVEEKVLFVICIKVVHVLFNQLLINFFKRFLPTRLLRPHLY